MIELLILITLQNEIYSIYKMRKKIQELFSPFLKVSFGAIYPALKKLEEKKCVKVKHHISPGGQKRISYSLTETGKKYFIELMQEKLPENPSLAKQLFNIKIIGLPKIPSNLHKPVINSLIIHLEKQKSLIINAMSQYSGENEKLYNSLMKHQLKKLSDDTQWINSLI